MLVNTNGIAKFSSQRMHICSIVSQAQCIWHGMHQGQCFSCSRVCCTQAQQSSYACDCNAVSVKLDARMHALLLWTQLYKAHHLQATLSQSNLIQASMHSVYGHSCIGTYLHALNPGVCFMTGEILFAKHSALHEVTPCLCVNARSHVAQGIFIAAPHVLQDPTRSKTATVLNLRKLRPHLPRTACNNQNIVLQTSQAETRAAIPGENPLVDLMQRCSS